MTELLKEIRRVSLQIETNTSVYGAMNEAKSLYYNYRQEQDESNTKRLRNFKSIVEAIEPLRGPIFVDKSFIDCEKELDVNNSLTINRNNEEVNVYVMEKLMAVDFLKRAKYDYKKLMSTIRDQHTFGIDVYPNTLHDAYELMENHSSTDKNNREEKARKRREKERISGKGKGKGNKRGRNSGRERGGSQTSFQFLQASEPVADTDGRIVARIICFKYGKVGHFDDMCSEIEDGITQNFITEVGGEAKNEAADKNHENSSKNEWIKL